MTANALKRLALMAELPSTRADHVAIETAWGWHYMIETDEEGRRLRVRGRCSLDGTTHQHVSEFELGVEEDRRFIPSAEELGVRG